MGKVLIIGAGGVATVAAHKVAQHPEVFNEIMIASRTQSKCDAIVKAIGNPARNVSRMRVLLPFSVADSIRVSVAYIRHMRPSIISMKSNILIS